MLNLFMHLDTMSTYLLTKILSGQLGTMAVQLGNGTKVDSSKLVQVINSDGSSFQGVAKLSAGLGQVVSNADGTVWQGGTTTATWGWYTTDRTHPVRVTNEDGTFLSARVWLLPVIIACI